jgi:hypothetical protein
LLLGRQNKREHQFRFVVTVDGVSVRKTFEIDPPRSLDLEIVESEPYIVGVPIALKIRMPVRGEVRIETADPDASVVIGPIVSNVIPGDVLSLGLIPLVHGVVKLPTVTIDGLSYFLNPELIEVVYPKKPLRSPMVVDPG